MSERNKIPERRKRYGWLVVLTFLVWLGIGTTVAFVDPENIRDLILPGSYLLFTSLLATGLFLLLSIIFLSTKRALWWTAGIIIFLYFRIWGLGNLVNGLLLLGVLISLELYTRMAGR